jgi:hypothetical protein
MKEKRGILQWIFKIYLIFALVWISIALSFDVVMLVLHFSNREDLIKTILNKLR